LTWWCYSFVCGRLGPVGRPGLGKACAAAWIPIFGREVDPGWSVRQDVKRFGGQVGCFVANAQEIERGIL
jgi:hypothetical protein